MLVFDGCDAVVFKMFCREIIFVVSFGNDDTANDGVNITVDVGCRRTIDVVFTDIFLFIFVFADDEDDVCWIFRLRTDKPRGDAVCCCFPPTTETCVLDTTGTNTLSLSPFIYKMGGLVAVFFGRRRGSLKVAERLRTGNGSTPALFDLRPLPILPPLGKQVR